MMADGLYYTKFNTWLGEIILLFLKQGLVYISLSGQKEDIIKFREKYYSNSPIFLSEYNIYKRQILQYFSGERQEFSLPLFLHGTEFQKQVWQALQKIPFGQVASYKDIAQAIGNPKAFRAVGNANSKNPIPIVIPCHRIIKSNGELGGFTGDIEIKKNLLEFERSNRNYNRN